MSIINSFDNKSRPLLDAYMFYKNGNNFADVCIVTFSKYVLEMFLNNYKSEIVGHSATANGQINIYMFEEQGKKILFYMSPIGAPGASAVMHEVHYVTGASKFIVYGSCGVLDEKKCSGRLIVPTDSYRDEGVSYHYMEPSDYVHIKNNKKLVEIFEKNKIPYAIGKAWTTDAVYMETINKADARRKDGCIAVEMESSALQAICNYYGYELYTFFFGGDVLSNDDWDQANLGGVKEMNIQTKTFLVAVKIALEI